MFATWPIMSHTVQVCLISSMPADKIFSLSIILQSYYLCLEVLPFLSCPAIIHKVFIKPIGRWEKYMIKKYLGRRWFNKITIPKYGLYTTLPSYINQHLKNTKTTFTCIQKDYHHTMGCMLIFLLCIHFCTFIRMYTSSCEYMWVVFTHVCAFVFMCICISEWIFVCLSLSVLLCAQEMLCWFMCISVI